MQVGDTVASDAYGNSGRGRVEAIHGGRALVRLNVRQDAGWTSPLTGGTVPAGCPRTYLLWVGTGELHATDV